MYVYRLRLSVEEHATYIAPTELRQGDVIAVRDEPWRVVSVEPDGRLYDATVLVEHEARRPA